MRFGEVGGADNCWSAWYRCLNEGTFLQILALKYRFQLLPSGWICLFAIPRYSVFLLTFSLWANSADDELIFFSYFS